MLTAIALGAALIVSLTAPILLKPLLQRMGVIDVPNARSSHRRPVLRGMGLAPLFAVVVGYLILLISPDGQQHTSLFLIIVAVSIASGVLGWIEDLRGLTVGVRAGAQLLIGLVGAGALCATTGSAWWLVPVFGICIASYINVANFMDGINGISGLHGAVVGIAYAVMGALLDETWMIPAGLLLAVSFLGFLPWNLIRGGAFLGDVGSYLLGSVIGIIGISAVLGGVPVLAVIGPLAIYLADTGATLLRRVVRGERWQDAHRTHAYQRLTDSGFSHVTVALIVMVATLVTAAFGLLSVTESVAGTLLAVAGIAFVAAWYLALPRLQGAMSPAEAYPDATSELPNSDLPARITTHTACKWAVIGGSGFIGSAVTAELRDRGFDVVCVAAPRLQLRPLATSQDALERLEATEDTVDSLEGVDVVVNAAGLASPGSAAVDALFGANALLPLVILRAAEREQVARVIHLSSAAVQGRRAVLDESAETSPFSPYSKSKALGEAALLSYIATAASVQSPEIVIVRATSVQGPGRATTRQLQRFAHSPLASVAWPGDRPTVVSSLQGLVEFVISVGAYAESVPTIVLQPWEGMTTSGVLRLAGGRVPLKLPAVLCRVLIALGYSVGCLVTSLNGLVRRVELMWLGQGQDAEWARSVGLEQNSYVVELFGKAQKVAR